MAFDYLQFALIRGSNIPSSYAILLFTTSDLASITSYIHNWVLFLLWLHLFIVSGVRSPLISNSILVTYQPVEFIFQMSYLFAFSYCSWGSQVKNTEVACHSRLQWTTFCQNSPPWPVHLGWPYMAWLSFPELDKVVVHEIRLVSFLWLWFQSVCPLMPSLSAYNLTGVSPTLHMWYLFTGDPAECGHYSLSWTWGISLWPPLLTLDVGYLLSTTCSSSDTQLPLTTPAPHNFIRTDSNVFLFYGWVIFHCVHVPQLLYPFICFFFFLPFICW